MATARSKLGWKARFAVLGVLAGAVGGVLLSTPAAEAAPTQSIYRTYYNKSFTTAVGGRWILQCGGGGGGGWGSVTQNYVQLTSPCAGSQPPLKLCYVDGSPDACPPGV